MLVLPSLKLMEKLFLALFLVTLLSCSESPETSEKENRWYNTNYTGILDQWIFECFYDVENLKKSKSLKSCKLLDRHLSTGGGLPSHYTKYGELHLPGGRIFSTK
jgi:hypothetical protein